MHLRHVFLLLAVAAAARATTVEPPAFSELVAEADAIYRGRVIDVQSRRVSGPGGASTLKTFVTLAIDRTLKGSGQKEIVLQFLGGTVGDETLEIDGVPGFTVGDREILFVQKNGAQFCPLVRVMHGRYRVARDEASGRDYVARDNRAPLTDVAEVAAPLPHTAEMPAAPLAVARALSPEAFEAQISAELSREIPVANRP